MVGVCASAVAVANSRRKNFFIICSKKVMDGKLDSKGFPLARQGDPNQKSDIRYVSRELSPRRTELMSDPRAQAASLPRDSSVPSMHPMQSSGWMLCQA